MPGLTMKRRKFLKSMTALAAGSVLPAAPAIWTPATTVCPPIVGPSLTICPGREFAASSFVHTPLADNAPLDPNSAAWVTHIQNEVAVFAFVNIDQYCPPIYIVDATQPTMQIKGVRAWDLSFDQWGKAALESQLNAVPVPDNFMPSAGNDEEAIIYQPSTKKYWEVWGCEKTGAMIRDSAGRLVPEWQAAWGGYIADISVNQGWFERDPVYQYFWGAMATSIVMLGTVMTVAEQQAGVINHPLQLAITYTQGPSGSIFSRPPAQRSDGWVDRFADPDQTHSIPEGVGFRLPASLNLDAMHMDSYARMIAKAVQRYGMYVTDTAWGGGLTFRAENPSNQYPGGDPYQMPGGILNCPNPPDFSCRPDGNNRLAGFPWNQLQALPANLVTE